jgi:integrase
MRVRVVGLNRYTDRHGKVRLYWRRKGAPAIALDPQLSGAALIAKVAELEKRYLKPAPKAGTLRLLIGDYKAKSNHWRDLRPRTRKDYERVFAWLGRAVDEPAIHFTAPVVAGLRDKARDAHEPKFANQLVTTLKMVFRFAVEHGDLPSNPATGLEKATGGKKRPNRPIAPWEALNLLHGAPTGFLPVVALAIYCGIREGDIAALPRNAVSGDWLGFEQSKTKRWHEAFISDDLRTILSKMPTHNATTLLVSSHDRPWTVEGIKSAWERLRDRLEAAGQLRPGATFHGLRHTGATWLEEAGYEEGQTKHFLGHGPKTVSGRYGQSASRRKLVREMSLVIEAAVREAQGNVVRIGNERPNRTH